MSSEEDEANIIDTSGKQYPICLICKVYTLVQHPDDPAKLQCPYCLREYMPFKEQMASEDEMVSVHEDEMVELGGIGGGSGLMVEADDHLMQPTYGHKPKIALKEGETLTDYREQDPSTS